MAEIRKVGVLGAGLMGHGIAQVAATAGHDVVLRDVDEDAVGRGVAKIEKQLARAVEKGRSSQEDADAIRARIQATTDYADLADCDLVIEAITENLGAEARDVARGRRHRQGRRDPRDEHVVAGRDRPGRGHGRARTASSGCTSSTPRRS